MAEAYHISLIFNEPDGFTHDLIEILNSYNIRVYPSDLNLRGNFSKNNALEIIKKFKNDYDLKIRSNIKDSKVVVFVATNDSVKSSSCIELIKLSENLNIPVITLIIEDNDEITELQKTDNQYDLYKDRVYDDSGYDPYMWLGECFKAFKDHIEKILGCMNPIVSKRQFIFDPSCYVSYSLCKRTSENHRNIIRLFNSQLKTKLYQCDGFNFLVDTKNLSRKEISGFDYYEYFLKRASIEYHIDSYLAIMQIFDNIIENAEIFKNEEFLDKNHEFPYFYCSLANYSYVYRHIEAVLKKTYKIDERITLFLIEEMNKYGIDLDLVNHIFAFVYSIRYEAIYEQFNANNKILFVLTKEYYGSKKFKCLYNASKRMNKNIFLVKVEKFDLSIDDDILAYDLSRHADCNYEGFLTRKLLKDVLKDRSVMIQNFNYGIWYDIFISSINAGTAYVHDLKNIFKLKQLRIKCKIDIKHDDDRMNEVNDDIQKSKIIIFCITNDYLKSIEFQNEVTCARDNKKPILFLLMEKIDVISSKIDLTSLDTIEIYRNPNFKGESFYRLCYFVYSLLDSKQNKVNFDDNGEVHLKPIDSDDQPQRSYFQSILFIKRGKLVAKLELTRQFVNGVAYIKHLNSYCIVTDEKCLFYDSNFKFTHEFIHPKESIKYFAVLYDDKNENIYLAYYLGYISLSIEMYDKTMMLQKNIKLLKDDSVIEILNDRIILITNKMLIYSLNLELLIELPYPLKSYSLSGLSIVLEPRCSHYIYIRDYENHTLRAFNINSFKFNENISSSYSYNEIFESERTNNLVFIHNLKESLVFVYEIDYNQHERTISSNLTSYVCKLAYPPHLLNHPYLLPCGSLACLECIYENYNLYFNRFNCFACGSEHKQNKELLMESSVIKDNLKTISVSQVENLKLKIASHDLTNKIESIENMLNFLEEEIEIRVESIKKALDENELIQLKSIDRLKRKLLKKSFFKNNNLKLNYDLNIQKLIKNLPNCEIKKSNIKEIKIKIGLLLFSKEL